MKHFFTRKTDENEETGEIEELRNAVLESEMPEQVATIALKEVDRLFKTSPSSAEYTIGINYMDYMLSLPWNKVTDDDLDISRAETILNREHFGLDRIKERILEHLAVRVMKMSDRKRILVVDDEEMTCRNLEHVLEKEGYKVESVSNGSDALGRLDEIPYDLVITDLKMEKVDGMAILERVRKKCISTQVIVITGYATVKNATDAMSKGSYHFLAKPLKLDEVRNTVKKALRTGVSTHDTKSPVLCFAGPPGTGKTSLGMSIARSLKRKFIRISLAGIKDETEIRGHRRSYVGAMAGRIIQGLRRAESSNPVFMLDELDKIGREFKGDPAAALLEVLDPQQNSGFMDHYLDVPYDLSNVMFIATANVTSDIPAPLLDRLEVIHLSGYTMEEKIRIAFDYLIPRAIQDTGLSEVPPRFETESVQKMIKGYTREAGLRNLERNISSICRKIALKIVKSEKENASLTVTPETVEQFLGPEKYFFEVAQAKERSGFATGLALTGAGGEIMFVEATRMAGHNKLILTGSLGDVMKESAQAAMSYLRSHTENFGLPEMIFDGQDVHIHVPAGAIPKDGPSAGLTVAAALISLYTRRPCRRDVAMSGELTLSGRILPVGGIKEKILAAVEAGIKTVIFPGKNQGDLKAVSQEIMEKIEVRTADEITEIIDVILK
ncbi:MAG: endopeptidase La [Desulfarculaceae bacterium]|nr:endopeptidase La [Desulfarculaceae bacterium]